MFRRGRMAARTWVQRGKGALAAEQACVGRAHCHGTGKPTGFGVVRNHGTPPLVVCGQVAYPNNAIRSTCMTYGSTRRAHHRLWAKQGPLP
jgi:hypothetical protein